MRGYIRKLVSEHVDPIQYYLPLDEERLHLNPLIGSRIALTHTGNIRCSNCDRVSRKSYSQGYCYPCFKKLPQCDLCMMSPDRCHFSQGTCRDESFGERFCMQRHIVYLANSSGLKVGITKSENIPTRWIDQGAVQAMPIAVTQSRQIAGHMEALLKQHISDKTQWQKMLKSEDIHVDLEAARQELLSTVGSDLDPLLQQFGPSAYELVADQEITTIQYPVSAYPTKVVSLSFDKTPEIEGLLLGIKGQYLIFDIGVINIRRFGAYEVEVVETSAGLF